MPFSKHMAPALALSLGVTTLPAFAGLSFDSALRWTYQDSSFPRSFDESAAEIVDVDLGTGRVFVVNGYSNRVDVLDVTDGHWLGALDVSSYGSPNSVAVKNGKVAIAVQNADPQAAGSVVFFDTNVTGIDTGNGAISSVSASVGAMPDMVTFTPDGSKVLTANEGEPNFYGQDGTDPVGSISVVDVSTQVVKTAGFGGFDKNDLVANGVRITSPGTGGDAWATAAQDIEPEYITLSADGETAYVTLQENNAIAVVDIPNGTVTAIHALGTKDHGGPGNGLDASDKDDAINIQNWPVQGMYMPDTIASYQVGDHTYLVTANEGDSREYEDNDGNVYSDEARVKDLDLAGDLLTDTTLQDKENLGRLTVSSVAFDGATPSEYDELFSFGARSFSIWSADSGELVFDSGDDFEQITALLELTDQDGNPVFNSDNAENDSFDKRSDNKGPEPEALAIGIIDGYTLAFIGLERLSAILIYDITNPFEVVYMDMIMNRNFTVDADTVLAGDLGPEGLRFVSALDSPFGHAGLLVANEVSGTTSWWDISVPASVPAPAPLALIAPGLLLLLRSARRDG